MNKSTLTLLLALAAVPVLVNAQEATPEPKASASSRTRAEVMAELRASQATGEYARSQEQTRTGLHVLTPRQDVPNAQSVARKP